MPTALNELLRAIKSLEPLPEVALRIFELARKPDVVPRELVAVVQSDAGLTAKLLKLSNSSLYGFRRRISSLDEAGNLLGVTTVVNLVLTSCAVRYFRDYGHSKAAQQSELWTESVSNALAASLLCEWNTSVDPARAYTVGLLQNMGRMVVQRFLPSEHERIQAEVAQGAALVEAEARVLGLDHAEIGARLAENWSFPEALADAIRCHHNPEKATADLELAYVAYMAEELTIALAVEREATMAPPDPRATPPAALQASKVWRKRADSGDLAALKSVLASELDRAREFVELA